MSKSQAIREKAIKNLQRLYTVVIGLSITQALSQLFLDFVDNGTKLDPQALANFACFFFTIVPFYQGANTYLDRRYASTKPVTDPWMLFVDFLVIFIEGIFFFLLSLYLSKFSIFFISLIILLGVDALWVCITANKLAGKKSDEESTSWVPINIGFALAIGLTISWCEPNITCQNIVLVILVILRTLVDYRWNIEFYLSTQ